MGMYEYLLGLCDNSIISMIIFDIRGIQNFILDLGQINVT